MRKRRLVWVLSRCICIKYKLACAGLNVLKMYIYVHSDCAVRPGPSSVAFRKNRLFTLFYYTSIQKMGIILFVSKCGINNSGIHTGNFTNGHQEV